MLRNLVYGQKRSGIIKGVVTGAIIGGVLGAIAAFLYRLDAAAIPWVGHTLKGRPSYIIIAGMVLGILVGAGIKSVNRVYIMRNETLDNRPLNHSKLQLREEQLDISKKWVETGKVTVHKEVLTEEKNIIVPITREELVIEKKVLDKEDPNKSNERTETIRIPISEEHIEVMKHPIVKEDIAVYKQQIQKNEHIEEILKKEKLHIKTTGEPEIKNKET